MSAKPIAASYRDPSGHVFDAGDAVLRSVMPPAAADFEFVGRTGLLEHLVQEQLLIPFEPVDPSLLADAAPGAVHVLRHPRLPFISHPYEWPFPALQAAAVFHLDVHLRALEAGVTLADASAHNVQFAGSRPVFIDLLSFRPYQDGMLWAGHRQFCEQFLNPLLLTAATGVPYHAWYRGAPEGIPSRDVARLLPKRRLWTRRGLLHVYLMGRLEGEATQRTAATVAATRLPSARLTNVLKDLRDWIAGLEPGDGPAAGWARYADANSYLEGEREAKRAFVRTMVAATRPGMLWDVGCNTGEFAALALESGAGTVIGFDADHGALNAAFEHSATEGLSFLPLYLDATNPTPDQGWAEGERVGLASRRCADAVLALALVHHLAIGRNVPLDDVVRWIASLAPTGVIEFVPKADPMVQRLLALRPDIFDQYDEATFLRAVERVGRVVETARITASGRLLVRFERG
ncbi:MAG: class I SAM-dependent methyltransferase [Gemmatimonadota bacterium]